MRRYHDREIVHGAVAKMTFRQIDPPTPNFKAPVQRGRRGRRGPRGAAPTGVPATPPATGTKTGSAALGGDQGSPDPFRAPPATGTATGTAAMGGDKDSPDPFETPPATGEKTGATTSTPKLQASGRDARGDPPEFFANRDSYNSLIPYLALGFVPQFTRTTNNLCALYALAESLRAARNLNSPTPIPEENHVTAQQMIDILRGRGGTEFRDKVEAILTDDDHIQLGPVVLAEHRRTYTHSEILDVQQIRIMLMVINDLLNTNYVLGYITQGFRTGYQRAEEFRASESNKTDKQRRDTPWRAQDYVWRDGLHVNTNAVTFSGDGRSPVVWIWNDNYEAITEAQDGNKKVVGHWEGLAPIADPNGRARVESWGLEQRIADDIAAGVWRANRNTYLNGYSNNNANPVLCCGHFVREALFPVDDPVVPESRYVRTSAIPSNAPPGAPPQQGWVVNQDLTQVIRTPPRPAPPRTNGAATTTGRVTDSTPTLMNSDAFKIFRAITLTNKIGGPRNENGAEFIQNFNFVSGAFFYDRSTIEAPDVALVRTLDGRNGRAYRRHLQLVQNPWGLGDRLTLVAGNAADNSRTLPLARVARNIPRSESGDAFLLQGEIVLMTSLVPCGGAMTVRDFENQRANIPMTDLNPIQNAFGMRINTNMLNARLRHLMRPARATSTLVPGAARKRKANEVDEVIQPQAKRLGSTRSSTTGTDSNRWWMGCGMS
jgi:hypothetical protein